MPSQAVVITATNNTDSPVGYAGYSNLDSFTFDPGTCGAISTQTMLGPGSSCNFSIAFNPTALGAVSGDFLLSTSSGTSAFHLSGAGVPVATAVIEGTITNGYDTTGVFGPPLTVLTGPIKVVYKFFLPDTGTESYTCEISINDCGSVAKGLQGSATVFMGGGSYIDTSVGSTERIFQGLDTVAPAAYQIIYGTKDLSIDVEGFPIITSTSWSPGFDWRSPFSDARLAEFPEGELPGQFIISTPNAQAGAIFSINSVSQTNAVTCSAGSIALSINNTTGSQPNILGGKVSGTLPNGDHYGNDQTAIQITLSPPGNSPIPITIGDYDIGEYQHGDPYRLVPPNEGLTVGAVVNQLGSSTGNATVDYYSYLSSSPNIPQSIQYINDVVTAQACGIVQSQPLPIYEYFPYLAGAESPRFDLGKSQVDNATYVKFDDLSTSQIETFLQKVASVPDVLFHFYLVATPLDGVNTGFYDENGDGVYHQSDDGYPYCSDKSTSCVPEGTEAAASSSLADEIQMISAKNNINPKLLLVKLQVEQSLLTATSLEQIGAPTSGPNKGMPATPQQTDAVFNYATGCNGSRTLLAQLKCSAETFSNRYQQSPKMPYFWPTDPKHVSSSIQYAHVDGNACIDNVLLPGCNLVGFWVSSASTFAQYKYTPFVQTSTAGGGVRSFEHFWYKYSHFAWGQ